MSTTAPVAILVFVKLVRHDTAPTQYVEAEGIRLPTDASAIPSASRWCCFQHFMGNLDDHDPALSEGFATDWEVNPAPPGMTTRR